MSDIDIGRVVLEELNNIAPEVDLAGVDPATDLHEAIDIDSMDFLNFVTALHHRLGIDIPELWGYQVPSGTPETGDGLSRRTRRRLDFAEMCRCQRASR